MKKILVRTIQKADIAILHSFRNSPLFIKFCTNRQSQLSFEEFELELASDFMYDRSFQFIIEVEEVPVGTIWIYNHCLSTKSAFITTFISEAYISKGYGVFAHCRVLQFMFETYGLNFLFSDAYESNLLSIRTMKKRGWIQIKGYRKERVKVETAETILRFFATLKNFREHGQRFANECIFINP